MGSRLEALVNNRSGSRSEKKHIHEELLVDTKPQTQKKLLDTPECFGPVGTWDLEDANVAYKGFFNSLKAAISDDEVARSIQLLNARRIAKNLISRLGDELDWFCLPPSLPPKFFLQRNIF